MSEIRERARGALGEQPQPLLMPGSISSEVIVLLRWLYLIILLCVE